MDDFYTIEEWRTLQFAPLWVMKAVGSTAGRAGKIQDSILDEELGIIRKRARSAFQQLTLSGEKREFPYDGLELERLLVEEGWSLLETVVSSTSLRSAEDGQGDQKVREWFSEKGRDPHMGLKQLSDLLDEKAPDEHAREFREFLIRLGQRISDATGGGLFGLGKKVRKKERAALDLLEKALRGVMKYTVFWTDAENEAQADQFDVEARSVKEAFLLADRELRDMSKLYSPSDIKLILGGNTVYKPKAFLPDA
jgi:hypothetical protein